MCCNYRGKPHNEKTEKESHSLVSNNGNYYILR